MIAHRGSLNLDPAAVDKGPGKQRTAAFIYIYIYKIVVGVILGVSLSLCPLKPKLWVWVICTARHLACLRDTAEETRSLV